MNVPIYTIKIKYVKDKVAEVGGVWEAIQSVTRRWVVSGKRCKALHGGGWCLGSDTKRYKEVGGVREAIQSVTRRWVVPRKRYKA